MLKYSITALFVFFIVGAKSQNIGVVELIKLANISHNEAAVFLTTEKYFKLLSSTKIYGEYISQYCRSDSKSKETIIKNQWRDTDKIARGIIHYEFKPELYVNSIIKELRELKFKIVSKIDDNHKKVWLYDNGLYTISIYTFKNRQLPTSVELHVK
jgi:hypothetical protein